MNESQIRQNLVGVLQRWIGRNESNGGHKEIIDIYNSHTPLARGYKVSYKDEWCATCASAAAIVVNLTDIIPTECSCNKMIELFKNLNSWQENDSYVPKPGDYIFYDWDDKGDGDNTGRVEHVGVVETVAGSTITVIEGNKKEAVARRNLKVNGKYIRGYGVPKYESKATETTEDDKKEEVIVTGELKVGDVVIFTGNKHYSSSYPGARASSCRSGKAMITAISKGKAHPYHLKYISDGGSNVYGWVDIKDIKGATSTTSEIKVGDIVTYSGTIHYTSCYSGANGKDCKGGKAKVTDIKNGKMHPYHLVHSEKGCTVYGWVDADKVTK